MLLLQGRQYVTARRETRRTESDKDAGSSPHNRRSCSYHLQARQHPVTPPLQHYAPGSPPNAIARLGPNVRILFSSDFILMMDRPAD